MQDEEIYGDFVTVAQFGLPYQAHLLAGSLEAEGIMAFIKGENMTSVYPFLTSGNNGIHVQVRASQVEKAKEIIRKQEESVTPSDELPAALDVDGLIYEKVHGICPECSQASIYMKHSNAINEIGVAVFILAVTIPVKMNANYICYNCHYNWNG
jgi:hypothetical protein